MLFFIVVSTMASVFFFGFAISLVANHIKLYAFEKEQARKQVTLSKDKDADPRQAPLQYIPRG